ncbi:unnamed protein product [Oikopleura dioica]|uniref:Ribosomal protein L7/L12 C-terminal domain-containing protein n=1 Tax=Oikopleura dioica TaxID=34765 RepID=E4XP35_OIKDI|nr:unnamed protein product [Oikopleura dioica]
MFTHIIRMQTSVVRRSIGYSAARFAAVPKVDDEERQPSEKVVGLVDAIAGLTLQEVADLNTALKKRLNISEVSYAAPAAAAAPVAVAAASDEAADEPKEEAKKIQTEFTVTMTAFDAKQKIKVIKAIKANMPDMNLVSAKKFVEALPKVLRQDVDKEEAEKIMEIFKAEGATVEMK